MRSCILLTLALVIELIKTLPDYRASFFCKMPASTVLIEIIADFLYRLKDRYPYSSSENKWNKDVFYMIMEFLIPNGYLPSAALHIKYSKSKLTSELNTLPTRENLNSKFEKNMKVRKENYEKLRKRFNSRAPVIFYFSPNIELQEMDSSGRIFKKGLFDADYVSANKCNRLEV